MSGAPHGTERTITFVCEGETLVGVLSFPPEPAPAARPAVLVVVGGPQYRVGSHRQFVQLARALAQAGHVTMRFDVRGMGDATGTLHAFEAIDDDIDAALAAFRAALPAGTPIALWGLCDGASAALMYVERHPEARLAGVAIANPWVRSSQSLARTQVKHYYGQRLLQREFWAKLLRGGVGISALGGLLSNLRAARSANTAHSARAGAGTFQQRMARGLVALEAPALLLLSEHDYTAREFEEFTAGDPDWQAALARVPPLRVQVPGADHTFSQPDARREVERATASWLGGLAAAGRAAAGAAT